MVRPFESHPIPQLQQCLCGQLHSPYVYDKHAHSINGQLVRCHACDLENVAFISHRTVCLDVVCRYIKRHGGSTFQVQTDIDNSDIYLRDAHGLAIARVSMVNRFKPKNHANLDNMPY
jgi:hypothetical protein